MLSMAHNFVRWGIQSPVELSSITGWGLNLDKRYSKDRGKNGYKVIKLFIYLCFIATVFVSVQADKGSSMAVCAGPKRQVQFLRWPNH